MAVAAMEWARRLRVGSASRKAVLFVLADRAKDRTWQVWAGQETIAEEADVSVRTVITVLATFEEWGLITRVKRRRPDGFRTSDLICLAVGTEISPEAPSPEAGSPEGVAGSADQPVQGHMQSVQVKSVQTSPANERGPHLKQLRSNNGKLEAEVPTLGTQTTYARGPSPSLTDLATDNAGFDEFIAAFPRQTKLKAARAAWRWALGHALPDTITAGAYAYAEWVIRTGERERFVEEPANWLSREGWADNYEPTGPSDPWDDWLRENGARTATAEELGLAGNASTDAAGALRASGVRDSA